jgi:hypothetical protein
VRNEAFGCQFGTLQIAARQPVSSDVELSGYSDGDGLQALIQQVDLCIRKRSSDRNRRTGFSPMLVVQAEGRYADSCFGGTVVIVDTTLWIERFDLLD